MKRCWLLSFWLLIVLVSCQDEKPEIITPVVLETSEVFTSKTVSEIKTFVSSTGLPISSSELKFDIEVYKVTYTTNYKGNPITASGLVILPKTNTPVGVLSFQHGTISAHRDAPTSASKNDQIINFYAAIASVGFVGVIPDYLGFGASKQMLHPYYVEEATANAVLDNIRAARELALLNGVNLNKKLFLAGYSEGGYATLATHKAIEETGYSDLDLVASFPASGGYDIKAMQEYFFDLETYSEPFYLAYVALAYEDFYGWNSSAKLFFQEPYASKIETLFDGSKSGSEINAQLTQSVNSLLTPAILNGIDTDEAFEQINEAFMENSLTDWKPTIPVYLYHGTADVTVPYQNSTISYDKLIAQGTSKTVLSLTDLPFATHSTGVTPYIIELTNKLLAFK